MCCYKATATVLCHMDAFLGQQADQQPDRHDAKCTRASRAWQARYRQSRPSGPRRPVCGTIRPLPPESSTSHASHPPFALFSGRRGAIPCDGRRWGPAGGRAQSDIRSSRGGTCVSSPRPGTCHSLPPPPPPPAPNATPRNGLTPNCLENYKSHRAPTLPQCRCERCLPALAATLVLLSRAVLEVQSGLLAT